LDEISSALDVDSSVISRLQSSITRSLNIQLPPIRPSALIPRLVNQIPIPYHVIECARLFGDNIGSLHEGVKPQLVTVVSIVYASIVCREALNIQLLLEVTGVALHSVQSLYSQVWSSLHTVIPTAYRATCNTREIPSKLDKALINRLKAGLSTRESESTPDQNDPSISQLDIHVRSSTPISDFSKASCDSLDKEFSRKRPKSQLFDALSPALTFTGKRVRKDSDR
jgi:hypothetical protein